MDAISNRAALREKPQIVPYGRSAKRHRLLRVWLVIHLLACGMTILLWAFSGTHFLSVKFNGNRYPCSLDTEPGRAVFFRGGGDEPQWGWTFFCTGPNSREGLWTTVARGWMPPTYEPDRIFSSGVYSVSIPFGWVLLVLAVPPVIWLAIRFRGSTENRSRRYRT